MAAVRSTPPALIPPDLSRCQAEVREGSFMTLGPRQMVRCSNAPRWIAFEAVPGEDGRQGSMSLCDDCKAVCAEAMGERVTFTRIKAVKA